MTLTEITVLHDFHLLPGSICEYNHDDYEIKTQCVFVILLNLDCVLEHKPIRQAKSKRQTSRRQHL